MTQVIDNNIQESYCSFETSKLLKIRGCKLPGHAWVERTDLGMQVAGQNANRIFKNSKFINDNEHAISYPMPTHALATEWIRVNFGIHINLKHLPFNQKYGYEITGSHHEGESGNLKSYDFAHYDNIEQATEAALTYTLEKLIQ